MDVRGLATGISGLATSGFLLFNQFDNLEKAQFRVAKAANQVEDSERRVKDLRDKLTEATAKYGENNNEAAKAQEALTAAQKDAELAQQRLSIAQSDTNQQMAQFALSIVPTAITMFTSLRSTLGTVRTAQTGWNTAMLANPIFLVIAAVGALITVLAVVTDGFRNWTPVIDAVNQALNFLLIPLQALLDAIGFFVPGAKDAADALRAWREQGIIPAQTHLETLTTKTNAYSTESLPDLKKAVDDSAVPAIKNLNENLSTTEDTLERLNRAVSQRAGLLGSGLFRQTPEFQAAQFSSPQTMNPQTATALGAIITAPGQPLEVGPGTPFGGRVIFGQRGFEGLVTSPTLFLAGEAGPERVRITPGGGESTTIILQLDQATTLRLLQGENVSIASGRRAFIERGNIF